MEAQNLFGCTSSPEFGDITLHPGEEKAYTIKWHVEY